MLQPRGSVSKCVPKAKGILRPRSWPSGRQGASTGGMGGVLGGTVGMGSPVGSAAVAAEGAAQAERCIPLHRLAVLQSTCNKERCVLAACRCIARAANCGFLLSDCHYFNFGVRINGSEAEHEVVIIDVGSRGIAESVPTKKTVNEAMVKLWKWTTQEILASPTNTQQLWYSDQSLEGVIKRLDTAWQSQPYLTETDMPTTDIEQDITAKCSST